MTILEILFVLAVTPIIAVLVCGAWKFNNDHENDGPTQVPVRTKSNR